MKIHLMGIGGTGMASLAGMLKARGHQITGSDQGVYPPMSELLAQWKIPVQCPYSKQNLETKPDLVIIGNVISQGNPEAEAVLAREIPYLSMPQAISKFFLEDKIALVIAGTHGKTTTTSLLSWILETAGWSPSFFVGGKPKNFPQNFQLGVGDYFVLEGDEYDTAFFDKGPKFLRYQPQHILLTSIEFDHADIYRDLDHVLSSFQKLLNIIPSSGSLIANLDYPEVAKLVSNFSGTAITYAMNPQHREQADYFGEIISSKPKLIFRLSRKNRESQEITWNQAGAHNVSNALGVIALAEQIDVDWDSLKKGLGSFQGVARRQDILGEAKGITIIDDFAHHPTSVEATIAAIKAKYPERRLWAIFEPRSNTSKRDVFFETYAQSFLAADQIILADVFMPEKVKKGNVLDVDALTKRINETSGVNKARHLSGTQSIIQVLKQEANPGDVLLFMSNGSFDEVAQKTLKALEMEASSI